jgi:hypothetical protein
MKTIRELFGKTLVLILIFAPLAWCGIVQGEDKVMLKLTARPGDTYRNVLEMIESAVTKIDGLSPGTTAPSTRNLMRMVIETKVDGIEPSGDMDISCRATELFTQAVNGTNIMNFASTDPASRKAAESDPKLAAILDALNITTHMVQEPTGDIKSVSFEGAKVDPFAQSTLEDNVIQPLIILPDHKVGVNEGWDAGSHSKVFASLGRMHMNYRCTLLSISSEKGEEVAKIGIKGTATLESDPESDTKNELEDFSMEGTQALSLTRGRFIDGRADTAFTIKSTSPEATFRMRSRSTIHSWEIEK